MPHPTDHDSIGHVPTDHDSTVNAEARQAWEGRDGAYWADHDAAFDAAVSAHHQPFMTAAALGPADSVLDIGCGNGQTTRDAARRAPDGTALGVDLSSRMLARARQRAAEEGITNIDFLRADAQTHPFAPSAFDVAISRTGAMFFADPTAAFANIARALRPNGRIVLLVWQAPHANEWFTGLTRALAAGRDLPLPPPDVPGPFALADPRRVRRLLTAAGYAHLSVDGLAGPMLFGRDAEQAYDFVRGLGFVDGLLAGLDPHARADALDALRTDLAAHASDDGVRYASRMWLITARRT
ncbi:class I SAM-dependent methyltransferase [Streptomyces sp. YU58]|uniref:class I SAM-dependent methyltransferase n=1 Tax=Streptomyces sp. SX92 TaxID=3158972 RepID=UPI0027BADBAC|nr:class I SAM-dependent methyltransferase [Streptomyces coralus]WLW57126.1 methyltransferase domain-containing protein [Streptomyces coralus]